MKPEISVVIASFNARKTIADCLASLERQATTTQYEVILVDSSTDGTAEIVERSYPQVTILRFTQRRFPGDARNAGIDKALGQIIAFLDADCVADPRWIQEIAGAHKAELPAIGGAIGNANPESYVGWAAYFTEFSHWMPGTQASWMTDIAGANMSYKRELFDQYGPFIEGTYGSDTDLHWRMARDGHRLRFEPAIVISHRNIGDLGRFLRHEYHHGRSFGRVHVRGKNLSGWNRALKVVGAPLCPLRMLATITANNLRNRVYLGRFVVAFPLVALGVLCWSMGQVTSYATG